ncbi:hypothetical protein RR48_03588 [Papilio machaon]|uniref:Uncharacterized protein n=1 Tax=Papilio machaon TaxID=76193 RepID=A0A0N1PGI1_PAPMA|nr:hypothetical protein RR48_03588 [Papilio machaon]
MNVAGRRGKGEGAVRARGARIDARHATRRTARRTQEAGRRRGTHAARLPALWNLLQNFSEGNLPSAGANDYLRELSPNAAPQSLKARYHIGTPLELISTSTLLKRFKSSVIALIFKKPGMTVTVMSGGRRGAGGRRGIMQSGHRLPCTRTTVDVDCEVQNVRSGSAPCVKPGVPPRPHLAPGLPTLALLMLHALRLPPPAAADVWLLCRPARRQAFQTDKGGSSLSRSPLLTIEAVRVGGPGFVSGPCSPPETPAPLTPTAPPAPKAPPAPLGPTSAVMHGNQPLRRRKLTLNKELIFRLTTTYEKMRDI